MRLDHLLSKEERMLVGVGLLLICQGDNGIRKEEKEVLKCTSRTESSRSRQSRLYIQNPKRPGRQACGTLYALNVHLQKLRENSGGDALRGNTRTHTEHDG